MTAATPESEAVVEKIVKLLNLAANNDNEAEAAAALERANALRLKHNLDSATIERATGADGKREQANVEGGFYKWQRELWEAVAELNFCYYWSQKYRTEPIFRYRRVGWDKVLTRVHVRVTRRRHALLGRTVNVRSTEIMARYLEGAIERVMVERFGGADRRDRYVTSFREGVAYRIRRRLEDRHEKAVSEDQKKARAAEDAAKRAGVSTSTAVTLSSYAKSEEDANDDFRFGKERMDAWRADRAAEAEARRLEDEAYVKWAADHPKEAAAREAKAREKREKATRRADDDRFGKVDDGAFWSGADAGEKVSLEPQVDGGRASAKKIAGRKS